MTDYDSNRKIWEQRLSNFENSKGVTVKAWCKNNGVSDPGFRYWRRKFKKEKMDADSPAFMPVEVIRDAYVTFEAHSIYLATLQVGTFLVNIPTSFDEAALSKLLKVVKSLC